MTSTACPRSPSSRRVAGHSFLTGLTGLMAGAALLAPAAHADPLPPAPALTIVAASPSTGPDQVRADATPPGGVTRPFDTRADLAIPSNGFAKPAVAKDVIAGYPAIHAEGFVNDGLYGNGASWIGASDGAWIKIDLGRVVLVDSIRFGRDRTGNFDDRDPGQFVVALATQDDVYASGNDQNDGAEYAAAFDSARLGFSGQLEGPQTVQASFAPTAARYLKLVLTGPGADVDELEVFGKTEVDACATAPCGAGTCTDLPGLDASIKGRTCACNAGLILDPDGTCVSNAPVTLKLATNVPTSSVTFLALTNLANTWSKVTNNQVQLKLFGGSTMGDENEIVKKLRAGTLQGAMLSTFGLHNLAPDPMVLDLPGLIANRAERDYVLSKLGPTLDAALAAKGFATLAWAELGTQRFFSTTARTTLDALKKAKLFAPQGQNEWKTALTALGLNALMYATSDLLPCLQTGAVDAALLTPVAALATGASDKTKSMSDLAWALLDQAFVIDNRTWSLLPSDIRAKLRAATSDAASKLLRDTRQDELNALAKLATRGVTTTAFTDATTWAASLAAIGPTRYRGSVVPAATYDAVVALLTEFRRAPATP